MVALPIMVPSKTYNPKTSNQLCVMPPTFQNDAVFLIRHVRTPPCVRPPETMFWSSRAKHQSRQMGIMIVVLRLSANYEATKQLTFPSAAQTDPVPLVLTLKSTWFWLKTQKDSWEASESPLMTKGTLCVWMWTNRRDLMTDLRTISSISPHLQD